MTDPSKRYWITEQGMKELAEDLRDHAWLNLSDPSELDCVIEMIAAHSEAASPPAMAEAGRCPLCGSGDPEVFLGKCAAYYSRREPAHIFHWESTSDCLSSENALRGGGSPTGHARAGIRQVPSVRKRRSPG